MPGNVQLADVGSPVRVFPHTLCRSFVQVSEIPAVVNEYRDGTTHRSKQADVPRRRWRLDKLLPTAALETLRAFYLNSCRGGLQAFYFYDPFEPAAGLPVGSNYDATGVSTQGRYKAVFVGQWHESLGIARTEVPLEILEVA
jgi:hypothetical protein